MKKFSIYACILALVLVAGSCKKLTEGLNNNPNSPTTAPYQLVLNGAEVSGILIYEGNLSRIAGMFSRSYTGIDRQYVALQNYNTAAQDYTDGWDNLYSLVIGQYKIVDAQASALNDKITVGITQVLLAQAFGLAADLFGDVPFTQAGNSALYPTPAFDKQATVYAGVITLLDSAITNLESGVGNGPGTKDFYFSSDTASWVAVAHTLLARYYLHTKDYTNALANAAFGISSPSGNMMDPHGQNHTQDLEVTYSFAIDDRVGYMSAQGATAVAYLNPADPLYKGNAKTNETARFQYMYQPEASFGTYLAGTGVNPNWLCDFDWGVPSNQNGFFGGDVSFPLVTYQENQLIMAEAYFKQAASDPASALAALNTYRAYLNGGGYINSGYQSAGLEYDPYTMADFVPGGIANPSSSGLSQNQALLKEILLEKYVSLIGQIEQFNDVRRTHNYIGVPPVTGTTLPQRFFYSQNEINTNPNTPVEAESALFTPTTVNLTAY